jgi:hypothetical protein
MNENLCSKCYILKNKDIWINQEKNEKKDIISFENFNPKYYSSKNELRNALLKFIPTINNFFYLNKKGYTIFHWYCWFISTNDSKYIEERTKYLWFFECLQELLSKNLFYELLIFGTKKNSKWTVLHHLVDNCVNVNVKHIQNFIKFLLESGLNMNMEDDNGITPQMIVKNKEIDINNSQEIKDITKKYKELENFLKKKIKEDYSNFFDICSNCNSFISYLNDMKQLSKYLLNNKNELYIFLEKYKVIIKNILEYREKTLELFLSLNILNLKEVNDSCNQHKYVIELYKSFI